MMTFDLPSGGTLTYLERADWDDSGAARLGHVVPSHQFKGLAVHHTVMVLDDSPGLGDEIAHMRRLRTCRPDLGHDVPYSFVVFAQADPFDVVVAEGRGPDRTGAHTAGYNSKRWGVAFAGNSETEPVTEGVVDGYRFLATWCRELLVARNMADEYVDPLPHRAVKATACPGRNVLARLADITPDLAATETAPTTAAAPDAPAVGARSIDERVADLELLAAYGPTDDQLVERLYDVRLGRRPDKKGRAYWLRRLTAADRATVIREFENETVNGE